MLLMPDIFSSTFVNRGTTKLFFVITLPKQEIAPAVVLCFSLICSPALDRCFFSPGGLGQPHLDNLSCMPHHLSSQAWPLSR